jgi:N-acyl-D-amino-acid deacylase
MKSIRSAAGIAVLAIFASGVLSCAEPKLTSTLIVNASIVDGTGSPAKPDAVRIDGDRIVEVGAVEPKGGERVIDAGGLTLAPGFIDTHSHHEEGVFDDRDALSLTTQGVTTIVAGQDGSMTYPVKELFERQEKTPVAVNVATYVGHGNLRIAVMGEDFKRHATVDEIARMRALVTEGMQAGALGLSTGLEYDPGIYSTSEEVIELAKEAARFGGRYQSHIRSEDRFFWAAVDEIVRIGREAGIPVQFTHMKLAMTDWWGQSKRLLDVLDRARADGVDITGDIYPYEYWQSNLGVMFPDRDFANRETAEFVLKSIAPPDGLLIARYPPDPGLEGMTVAQIATRNGIDEATTLIDLTTRAEAQGARNSVIVTSMLADDVRALTAWPHANICSDGEMAGRHPRGRGAFTKVLRVYVREQRLFSLEEAVRKMTSLSAAHVGIADRSVIRPGAYADLVLLDPARVADRSTIEDPLALSVGIEKVWVNGVVVLDGGKATGVFPGQAIRRPTK